MKIENITTNNSNTKHYNYSAEYQSLVSGIRDLYEDGKLSDIEAHQAARNFIQFVEILMKYAEKK